MGRRIVQYANENDYQAAKALADASGYELVFTNNPEDLIPALPLPLVWDSLIIVGGQIANAIFARAVEVGWVNNITNSDQGYIHIQYKFITSFFTSHYLWAVASYEIAETLASAQYLIGSGFAKGSVRVPIGTPPPPPASQVTSGITMEAIIEALKAGAPGYVVGAAVGIGSSFIDSGAIKKVMLLGCLAGIGIGGYLSIDSLHKQGVI
jgi:hypothetical protein